MNKHHPLGCSNYNAWVHCISWKGSSGGKDASIGTEVHSQFDRAFKEDGYEPDSYVARWAVSAVKELAGLSFVKTEVKLMGTSKHVKGIFGTADAIWTSYDNDGFIINIADLKVFSDGTKDYTPQLMGYAWLYASSVQKPDTRFRLHVLHGGICKVETIELTLGRCQNVVKKILDLKRSGIGGCHLCDYCSTCANVKECKEVMNAVTVVNDNAVDGFGALSLTQKLVVLDAVDKLSKVLREEAKKKAEENGGFIEEDGIRYELKPWAGKSKCRDLCMLAGAIQQPVYNRFNDKKETVEEVPFVGIDNEKLLELCDLPKTKLVDALKEANAHNKGIKKVEIERWVSSHFEKTEGTPHFVRTK